MLCLARITQAEESQDGLNILPTGRLPVNNTVNMGDEPAPEHVIDVARHGGTEILSEPVPPPRVGGNFVLDDNVIRGIDILLLTLSMRENHLPCLPSLSPEGCR